MKKWKFVIIGVIGISIIVVMYKQHQTILEYRQIPYYSLELLAFPIGKVIELHENDDNYEDDERKEMLDDLNVMFSTISNRAGVGLTTEQKIYYKYYDEYNDARADFAVILEKYMAAETPEQHEQAYKALKEVYDEYQLFLEQAEEDLMLPDPTLQ
ncbi:hypothetical protein [Solibacillus sp. FSL K6-1554]|uniref:hypothetical protein n=1 Tax=Solibacillus sp. FSL K6-1554 TaxID=2921472 RepID=UPI0030F91334